jgi:alanine dehydrogenase
MKIGIIREGKVPVDLRVPLTPVQCAALQQAHSGLEIVVEPSEVRIFSDAEYLQAGVRLSSKLDDCDWLLGVKEVPVNQLIAGKNYMFFSHTHKQQAYNRKLLQAVLEKNIRLVDYELITDAQKNRLVAFGYYAGVVGAHNTIWAYGQRTGKFSLPRLIDCHDYAEAVAVYKQTAWPAMRIVLTGSGRVAQGARRNLLDMGLLQVSPADFLAGVHGDQAVFTQLSALEYARRRDGSPFEKRDFYAHPEQFENNFLSYAAACDVFIHGIFWDARAPHFFELADLSNHNLCRFEVLGDVTCDIAPDSSIPSTLRPSTIAEPVYGVDRHTHQETLPYEANSLTMMAVDNLPTELPRDASAFFGKQLIEHVIPELVAGDGDILQRATIARGRQLTRDFMYLSNFVAQKV